MHVYNGEAPCLSIHAAIETPVLSSTGKMKLTHIDTRLLYNVKRSLFRKVTNQ